MKRKGNRIWIAVGVISCLVLAMLLVSPKPSIKYHPTDGMAMMSEYAAIAAREGAGWDPYGYGVRMPSEFVNYGVFSEGRPIPFVIQKITYHKGSPIALRVISRNVGLHRTSPFVMFQALAVDNQLSYIRYETNRGSKHDFSPFRSDSDFREIRALRLKLKTLPPNSRLRYSINFYAVQLGKEIRVYAESEFPAELNSARDALEAI